MVKSKKAFPKAEKQNSDILFNLRMTREEKTRWERAAKKSGIKVSALVRDSVNTNIKKIEKMFSLYS